MNAQTVTLVHPVTGTTITAAHLNGAIALTVKSATGKVSTHTVTRERFVFIAAKAIGHDWRTIA